MPVVSDSDYLDLIDSYPDLDEDEALSGISMDREDYLVDEVPHTYGLGGGPLCL